MKRLVFLLPLLTLPSAAPRRVRRRAFCLPLSLGRLSVLALLTAVILFAAPSAGHAQATGTLTTLNSFNLSDGSTPGALTQGSDGSFYGTTGYGGTNADNGEFSGYGTVFRITPAGALTTLYSFTGGSDGAYPFANLVQGSDGNFYGATSYGGTNGYGTIYRITSVGALTTSYNFSNSDGAHPTAALVQGSDGNFYGTTSNGGLSNDGTVFRITPAGVLTTLYSFSGSDGKIPNGLIQGSDGSFYGTTDEAGANGDGTVFRITPAGALTTLYSFSGSDGANASPALVRGSDGNFYGMTVAGGANDDGTVYQITPAGALTSLHNFSGSDGEFSQAGLIQGSDGSFYGTTNQGGANGDGTVFKLSVIHPGTLQLDAATATVVENAGNVTLTVSRTNGSDGAVSINYATADGTAVASTDYQAVSGTLTWADGDTTDKTITVPIIDRNLTSGSTNFLVNLAQPAGGATLASPAQATVTILDDDMPVADIQSVQLLSPPAGIVITQNQPVVLYAAVKALAGTLTNVEFFAIDSVNNSTDLGGGKKLRQQVTWQPNEVGNFTLQVVATDTQGNTMQVTSPIQVAAPDASGAIPQPSIEGSVDGITVALNSVVPVVAQAVDSDGNPLQNVQFYLDGMPITTTSVGDATAISRASTRTAAANESGDSSAGSIYKAEVKVGGLQQILTLAGSLSNGTTGISNPTTIYGVTNPGTPPTVAISSPASGVGLPAGSAGQSVSVAATNGSQPIAQVKLFVDSQNVGTATAAPYTFSLPALTAGSHILSAKATDTSQLSSVSASVIVTAPPAFFTGENALSNGVYYLSFPSGNFFGYYSFLADPAYLFHFDLGFEYVFDAQDGNSGVYLYDFASSTFFYTSPGFPFPYLYDFSLNTVLYYYPDPNNPGHYNTAGVRFFYDFNTGTIITK